VLRVRAFGESDKIVTFLTRDFGKLSGIAKGAAKSRRRFMGSLEPFTHVQLHFRASTQSDLCFIESADIVRAARKATLDLDRYAYSTYVVELIDAMVEGREAEAGVFDLAEEVLSLIDSSPEAAPSPQWLRHFELRLLTLTGLEPHLGSCGRCRLALAGLSDGSRFNPRDGTLLCAACSAGTGMEISSGAADAILALRHGPAAAVLPLPAPLAGEVRVILQTFIQHHIHRPLRSPGLLRQILEA
jgi:DNA repair protein RecO (recombination protein O)